MSFVIYNVIEYFQCLVIEHQDNTILHLTSEKEGGH